MYRPRGLCCTRSSFVMIVVQNESTALHVASRMGHVGVVELLLDHGADHRAVDRVSRCRPFFVSSLFSVFRQYVCLRQSIRLGHQCKHIQRK